jgi:general secretion pathway protein C
MKEEKTLHTLALVALLTVSAYFLADIVDVLIGHSLEASPKITHPEGRELLALRPGRELSDYSSILERGLFGEGKRPSASPVAAEAASYKLIGTVEGDVFSGAVLADSAGQAFYRLNRKLPDGSTLIKVMRTRITLRRPDGKTADIEVVDDTRMVGMPKSGTSGSGVRKLADGRFMVDQREVLASAENISQVLTQARAVPYMEQGKTAGFRISEIAPGSIYTKIGLENGDIIQRVNSQDLNDPGKFFQLYQGFRNERSIAIDLLRGGQRLTLNYEIR